MKNTKSFRLAVLVTVLSLILSAMVGISINAEADAGVEIVGANVAYNEMMHLAINLQATETLAEGAVLGLIIWDEATEGDLTVENAVHVTFTEKEDTKGNKYFTTQGIAAPEMADEFKLAGCIKEADGTVRIGRVISYSVIEYLNSRLNDDNVTPEQLDLYKKTIAYGKAAGAVFAN
jgi:hypothetical protein